LYQLEETRVTVSKEEQQVHLDQRMQRGVPQVERILGQSPSVVQAIARYSTSPNGAGDQFGPRAGARLSAETHILCKQSIARARDKIPGLGKGDFSSGILSEETSPLFPKVLQWW